MNNTPILISDSVEDTLLLLSDHPDAPVLGSLSTIARAILMRQWEEFLQNCKVVGFVIGEDKEKELARDWVLSRTGAGAPGLSSQQWGRWGSALQGIADRQGALRPSYDPESGELSL